MFDNKIRGFISPCSCGRNDLDVGDINSRKMETSQELVPVIKPITSVRQSSNDLQRGFGLQHGKTILINGKTILINYIYLNTRFRMITLNMYATILHIILKCFSGAFNIILVIIFAVVCFEFEEATLLHLILQIC